jgi:hypothetical protein
MWVGWGRCFGVGGSACCGFLRRRRSRVIELQLERRYGSVGSDRPRPRPRPLTLVHLHPPRSPVARGMPRSDCTSCSYEHRPRSPLRDKGSLSMIPDSKAGGSMRLGSVSTDDHVLHTCGWAVLASREKHTDCTNGSLTRNDAHGRVSRSHASNVRNRNPDTERLQRR